MRRRLFAVVTTLSLTSVAPSCASESGGDEALDPEGEAFGGPKADGFCVDEGTAEAIALLQIINDAKVTVDDLDRAASDGGAGLNRTAAQNIVAARPIDSLTALDAVANVGVDTCTKLVAFACSRGLCEAPEAACDVGNAAGREFDLVALKDPLAELVLKSGEGCPTDYAGVIAKLRTTDTAGCDGGGRDGISTMTVSEEAQLTGEFGFARAVTTRTCNSRSEHEIFFSLLGPTADALPEDCEVMGFDKEAGVYNYYTLEGGRWEFHGNSIDLVTTGTQRCAACHTGGGTIMKELDTPWLHWEGHEDTPGVSELVDAHDDLGSQSDGLAMEGIVKESNREWNVARLAHMRDNGTVADLLKPLFCTVELNSDAGADFFSPGSGAIGSGDDLSRIPADFFADPQWGLFDSVSIASEVYEQAIKDSGQEVRGNGGALRDRDGNPAIDTIFDFAFPERAFADNDFVEKLKDAGIVDEDFVRDVLAVDFTRPIFSDDRCGLLEFAPDLDPADRTAEKIRRGFIDNLSGQSAGSPGAQLLASLENTGDSAEHEAAVKAWLTACKARPQAEMMADVLKIASLWRNKARELPLFEFAAAMPFDDLSVAADAHFDPATCVVQ
jgi:hypothetical protein